MQNSKLIVAAAVAISAVFGISAASAADLPVRTYTKAPVMVDPAYNWSGCYVGLNDGGAWGRSNSNTVVNDATGAPILNANHLALDAADSVRFRPVGLTAGGQAGCNWQVTNVVFGLEADFGYAGLKDSQIATVPYPAGGGTFTVANSVKTDWLLTARGRAGYALGTWLPFVTGGLAVTRIGFATNLADVFGTTETAGFSTSRVGWTVGAGLEYAFLRNWSAKIEYLHADFGNLSVSGPLLPAGPPSQTAVHNVSLTMDIVRAGLNYKFGGM